MPARSWRDCRGKCCPKLIGVKLTGRLSGWASPKDVILYLCGLLTVKGGTNKIVEYFGPGAETISATGKGTICNMGAELGATTSVFPFDQKMVAYLNLTDRADIAKLAEATARCWWPILKCCNPRKNISTRSSKSICRNWSRTWLAPHTGPRPAHFQDGRRSEGKGLSGRVEGCVDRGCTNSSYEDIGRAAHIARQGLKAGLKGKTHFL